MEEEWYGIILNYRNNKTAQNYNYAHLGIWTKPTPHGTLNLGLNNSVSVRNIQAEICCYTAHISCMQSHLSKTSIARTTPRKATRPRLWYGIKCNCPSQRVISHLTLHTTHENLQQNISVPYSAVISFLVSWLPEILPIRFS